MAFQAAKGFLALVGCIASSNRGPGACILAWANEAPDKSD